MNCTGLHGGDVIEDATRIPTSEKYLFKLSAISDLSDIDAPLTTSDRSGAEVA